MNTLFRKPLAATGLDYFDAAAAVDALQPGAWATLPYTSRVHAENLVRRADPAQLNAYLLQLIERKQELDFPGFRRVLFATTSLVKPHWSTWQACVMQLLPKAVTRLK